MLSATKSPLYIDFEFELMTVLSIAQKFERKVDFKFRGGDWSSGQTLDDVICVTKRLE
jgi:hypothetical protein